jgi:hypothetical protein
MFLKWGSYGRLHRDKKKEDDPIAKRGTLFHPPYAVQNINRSVLF